MTHYQAADAILQAGDHVHLQLHRPFDPNWWLTSPSHNPLAESVRFQSPASDPPLSPSPPLLSTPPHPPPSPPPLSTPPHPSPSPSPLSTSPPDQPSNLAHLQLPEMPSLCHSNSQPHLAGVGTGDEESVLDSVSEPSQLDEVRDNVFDIGLRKGHNGFGFRLDRSRSGNEGK